MTGSRAKKYPIPYAAVLTDIVENYLDGALTHEQFEHVFYWYYLEVVPEDALTDEETELFGEIQEQLDWTAKGPDPESRRYGWRDRREYYEWVSSLRDRLRRASGQSTGAL